MQPYFTQLLEGSTGPIVAATDYMKAVPDSVRAFFGVDAKSIAAMDKTSLRAQTVCVAKA